MDSSNVNSSVTKVASTTPRIVRPWETSPKKVIRPQISSLQGATHHGFTHPTTTPLACTYQTSADSGYESDISTSSPSKSVQINKKFLNPKAVDLMETWYQENFDHPYPSDQVVGYFAEEGGITTTQVRKWMANKRVRSNNTLSFNGTIHPKRLQRLQKEYASPVRSNRRRHHPYSCATPKKTHPSESTLMSHPHILPFPGAPLNQLFPPIFGLPYMPMMMPELLKGLQQ